MFGLQVSKWLRPNVKQRGKPPGSGTIHIAKKTVGSILATAGTPYSLEDMRKMCLKLGPEANSDFRSRFTSREQETAMKFPRDKVQDDMLAVIDSGKCLYVAIHFYMYNFIIYIFCCCYRSLYSKCHHHFSVLILGFLSICIYLIWYSDQVFVAKKTVSSEFKLTLYEFIVSLVGEHYLFFVFTSKIKN